MASPLHLANDPFWVDAYKYKDAEVQYYAYLNKPAVNTNPAPSAEITNSKRNKTNKKKSPTTNVLNAPTKTECKDVLPSLSEPQQTDPGVKEAPAKKKRNKKAKAGLDSNAPGDSLTTQVQKVRQHLNDSLKNVAFETCGVKIVSEQSFNAAIEKLHSSIAAIEARLANIELKVGATTPASQKTETPKKATPTKTTPPKPTPKPESVKEEDDDVDLFGSDSEGEDEAAAKIREQRLAEYAAKKTKKPALVAKSNIIFDVKPWDSETDMKEIEAIVRSIQHEGLLWGAAKLVPLAYGIHKLQISSVIEDDKVSVDWLQETIEETGSELVQSVDIAAFNKI